MRHVRSSIALFCTFLVIGLETTQAVRTYFVSDQPSGTIWRLQDHNADGDALDAGEKLLWTDRLTSVVELEYRSGSLYAIEEGLADGGNQAVRLTDANGDGDALDVGEHSVWADGFDNPRGIAVDESGRWYVTETEEDLVWALTDVNGDGDALDVGERTLFADGIEGATTLAVHGQSLLVSGRNQDQIFRLTDGNADGDALDVGEITIVTPKVEAPLGILDDGAGGFFFSSFSNDAVYHAVDRNDDGDMLDVLETLRYADSVFGGLNGPWGMADHEESGFLLADFNDGQVLWVHDANGDGDALDLGDVQMFADGFESPVDVLAVETILAGDYNNNGTVDAADYTVWRDHLGARAGSLANDADGGVIGEDQYHTWKANFGMRLPATGSLPEVAVPEPNALVLLGLGGVLLLTATPPRAGKLS